jgi:hypothetical protein
MKWTRKATILCLTISVTSFVRAQTIASSEAKNHIEGKAASCGKVASERPATSSRGTPTYVDLDQPCDQGLWPRAGNRGLGAGLFTGLLLPNMRLHDRNPTKVLRRSMNLKTRPSVN